ncbi:hypothetical protein H632_c2717p1, partial [Helicosporidium sp. ATCC 50920]
LAQARKKAQARADAARRAKEDCEAEAARLEREHAWVGVEKSRFGAPGGEFDFAGRDMKAALEALEAAERKLEAQKARVNKKVMAMFERAEQEYAELRRKRDVVEADRSKIAQVMGELDEKKREALDATWTKVTRDFGAIFSTLLPGADARLEPVAEGADRGLQVRVAFGGAWKESLGELSGGQKSLLALSLILAMLLFKPAPIYILDEVDAALDLSHTQNVGRMIKRHFPQSQFLVVSLKEGMFANANVLFRTAFVNGVSAVSRTVASKDAGDKAARAPASRAALAPRNA